MIYFSAALFCILIKRTEVQLVEAVLPLLSEKQRKATGRDDRPSRENSLIFGFKTRSNVVSSTTLKLRGPTGYEFDYECAVEISESKVFGTGNRWPPLYSVWPKNVNVTACIAQPFI